MERFGRASLSITSVSHRYEKSSEELEVDGVEERYEPLREEEEEVEGSESGRCASDDRSGQVDSEDEGARGRSVALDL